MDDLRQCDIAFLQDKWPFAYLIDILQGKVVQCLEIFWHLIPSILLLAGCRRIMHHPWGGSGRGGRRRERGEEGREERGRRERGGGEEGVKEEEGGHSTLAAHTHFQEIGTFTLLPLCVNIHGRALLPLFSLLLQDRRGCRL